MKSQEVSGNRLRLLAMTCAELEVECPELKKLTNGESIDEVAEYSADPELEDECAKLTKLLNGKGAEEGVEGSTEATGTKESM